MDVLEGTGNYRWILADVNNLRTRGFLYRAEAWKSRLECEENCPGAATCLFLRFLVRGLAGFRGLVFLSVTVVMTTGLVVLVEHSRLLIGLLFTAKVESEGKGEKAESGGLIHDLGGKRSRDLFHLPPGECNWANFRFLILDFRLAGNRKSIDGWNLGGVFGFIWFDSV
jgi:hypothetical protein